MLPKYRERTLFSDGARRLAAIASALVLVATVSACGDDDEEVHFTPEKDDAVMAALESAWSEAPGGFSLSLCEDRDATDAAQAEVDENDCLTVHIIQGDGRGVDHVHWIPSGIGMGGCSYNVRTYVHGTIELGILDEPAGVEGTVSFNSLYDGDPYAYPYHLSLDCSEESVTCSLSGDLHSDGELVISGTVTPLGGDEISVSETLPRSGAMICE